MQRLRSLLQLLTLGAWVCTASSQSTVTSIPIFEAGTTDVTVDVIVTDHRGTPVANLTKDRFTVSENGRSQQIVAVEADPSPATSRTPAPLPPGVYTNAPVVSSDGAVDVLL